MTGFATLDRPATAQEGARRWEIRSVNARGLDIRLRLPEIAGLEALARAEIARVAARGNVTLALRLGEADGAPAPALDAAVLASALDGLAAIEAEAQRRGLGLAPSCAADLLTLRGVFEAREAARPPAPEACREDLAELLAAWDATRAEEGAALRAACTAHLDGIDAQVAAAEALAPARAAHQARALREAVARIEGATADPARVAQEIAVLAVRGDVTEELDRLRAHLAAARDLLAAGAPSGRRLDFLMQEFNREANTLCAKAQMAELTAVGLELKTLIDRLREQVQNVE
jgi:uncharacterized protein (TIGR00255 family)